MNDSRARMAPTRRPRVVRTALMYTALASVCAAVTTVAAVMIATGETGFVVMLVISMIFTLIIGYWALQYLRDLRTGLSTIEGEVMKKWEKGHPLQFVVVLTMIIGVLAVFRLATGVQLDVRSLPSLGALLILGFFGFRFLLPLLAETALALPAKENQSFGVFIASTLLGVFRPSFYLLVENEIYTVNHLEWAGLLETDLVRLTCYPHSLTVEKIERFDTSDKAFVPAASGSFR